MGTVGSSVLCMSIPYSPETLPAKVGAFTVFTSVMGASLVPLLFMGGEQVRVWVHVHVCERGETVPIAPCLGPLVARAAAYTAGVVGGLSLTAACAPSEKYLYMSGPLSLGLGVVLVSSIGE